MSGKSMERFKEKCKAFFDEANGGEPITPGQLARVIRKACPKFQGTDADIAQMFLETDDNDDRLVSWEEFCDAVFAKSPAEVTRSELEEEFERMDTDNSGKLSKDEIRALIEKLEIEVTPENLDALMEAADPNGDGVDRKEFLAAWAK